MVPSFLQLHSQLLLQFFQMVPGLQARLNFQLHLGLVCSPVVSLLYRLFQNPHRRVECVFFLICESSDRRESERARYRSKGERSYNPHDYSPAIDLPWRPIHLGPVSVQPYINKTPIMEYFEYYQLFRWTDTSFETPGSLMVTPYRVSAISMVCLLCVIKIN